MSSLTLPDTKNIADRFELDTLADICWLCGSFLAFCLLLVSLFTFTIILQHLYCIKDDRKTHMKPWLVKYSSISCCIFALICSIAGFSTFPVCTSYRCDYNTLGNTYFIINLISYIGAKLCLYILFIARLFNKHSQTIYNYSKCIKTSLEVVIALISVSIILTAIFAIIIDHYENNDKVDGLDLSVIVAVVIYVLADFILSGVTLVLFFGPLWNKMESKSTINTSKWAIIYKYGAISLIQTVISMIYGVSLIVRFVVGYYHTDTNDGVSYLDLCTVIQLLDMLITILCIYYGFVKKKTNRSYCNICCNPCYRKRRNNNNNNNNNVGGYKVLWDNALENKPINDSGNSEDNIFYYKEYETVHCETIEYETVTTQSTTQAVTIFDSEQS